MSKLNTSGRLSIGSFAPVPALGDLGEIQRPTSSLPGSLSSYITATAVIDPAEPCFITKAVLYTHEQVQWVSPVRSKDNKNELVSNVYVDVEPHSSLSTLPFKGGPCPSLVYL